jgi:hypothetical protein
MRVELLGASFTIQSDEDPAYLKTVIQFYSEKVAEIQQTVTVTDPLRHGSAHACRVPPCLEMAAPGPCGTPAG